MQERKKMGLAQRIAVSYQSVLPRNSVRRVAVVFVVLLGVLLSIATLSNAWPGWTVVTHATALVAGTLARWLGVDATVTGNLIVLPSRSLSVDPQCTAVTLISVYASLVLAYPVKARMRFLALVAGIPVLLVSNIVRLVAVAFASEVLSGRSFYLVHDYLFEFAMVLVVLLLWAGWLSLARKA